MYSFGEREISTEFCGACKVELRENDGRYIYDDHIYRITC